MFGTFMVSFFGHREIENRWEIAKYLTNEIENLIRTKDYVEFLVGRDGEFDILAASMIKTAQEKLDCGNSSLVLILPHETKEFRDNKASFERYYNEIEICEEASAAHFKGQFQVRNRLMVERSALVICYVEHQSGGAFQAVKYARKLKKRVYNIAEQMEIIPEGKV